MSSPKSLRASSVTRTSASGLRSRRRAPSSPPVASSPISCSRARSSCRGCGCSSRRRAWRREDRRRRPAGLGLAVNRYRMTCELARAGLPAPETTVTEDVDGATAAVERFGSAVLKPLFTSKGRGMRRLDPSMDLRAAFEGHRREGLGPFYLQRFVKHPGRDLGVAVLDGRYIGAYWRGGGGHPRVTPNPSPGGDQKGRPPPPA